MPNIHIVTDSCATFIRKQILRQNPVTVVPNTLIIEGQSYRDGIDITAEEVMDLIAKSGKIPRVIPPSAEDLVKVYAHLSTNCDAILSIHPSREIYPTWHHARAAAKQIMGKCKLEVIDSLSIDTGQGMLVEAGLRALQEHDDLDDIIQAVRGAVDRLYALYYVNDVDFLLKSQLLSASHAVLGEMLGIKPFLALEEGHLITIEKVKTRNQAVERMVEFAVEFEELEDASIVQHRGYSTEYTRMLQDRLAVEFPGQVFPHTVYGPALAAIIGTEASGIVVLENPDEDGYFDDDFD